MTSHFPLKVTWTGAVTDLSGYAEASREYVLSLLDAGVDVEVDDRSFEPWKPRELLDSIVDRRIWACRGQGLEGRKIHVVHLTPDLYREYNHPARIRVGTFAWETDKLPGNWTRCINEVLQELWVPCEYLKETCINSGVTVPTYVIPHAIPIKERLENPAVIQGLIPGHYNFYAILQWSGRKYATGLLRAYMEEFSRDEPVTLVFKTYRRNDDILERDMIRREISQVKRFTKGVKAPRILLIEQFLGGREIASLHESCDCCITMARSEGFGIPLFVSMSYGNPTIVPNYSAFKDFLTEETAYLVDVPKEISVGDMHHISILYTSDMKWGDPDIDSCRRKMREVFNNREAASQKGLVGQEWVRQNLSREVIGRMMKERLESLLRKYA